MTNEEIEMLIEKKVDERLNIVGEAIQKRMTETLAKMVTAAEQAATASERTAFELERMLRLQGIDTVEPAPPSSPKPSLTLVTK